MQNETAGSHLLMVIMASSAENSTLKAADSKQKLFRASADCLLLTAYCLAIAFHINARTSDCSSMTLVIGLPEP